MTLKLMKAELLFNMRQEDASYHQAIVHTILGEVEHSRQEMLALQRELEN